MINYKSVILKKNDTILKAIKTLDKTGLKIILVCEKNHELIATITDGDIRRAILGKKKLTAHLENIMKRNPLVANINDSDTNILSTMTRLKISQVPLVDNRGKVIGLKNLESFSNIEPSENSVILMAGGLGKRLFPLTKNMPKPLLKINNEPILEIILQKIKNYGFKNFYISTYYKANQIKKYFGSGKKWGVSIKYLDEKKQMGTAGCLSLLTTKKQKLHKEKKADVTVCVREETHQNNFGVIETKRGRFVKVVEKPVTSFFVNAGIYVINPSLLNFLKKGYCDMPDFLNFLKLKRKNIQVFPVYEKWSDVGSFDNLKIAQNNISS